MPPFRRYWNYRWKPKRWRRRRFRTRRRRLRPTFYRGKTKRRVRRNFYFKYRHKKLKKIKIQEWQPTTIKKCRIQGYLCLFQAGKGRYSFNYTTAKESFCPEHEPGGGGWGLQQLTLSSLYVQNCDLLNWWTKSNNHLNMCRYRGCYIKLYRQQFTDYIFTYLDEEPKTVSKYYYATYHPAKLLLYNRRVVVPSYYSQPHNKKSYKKIFIKPRRMWRNQWYFQQQIAQFPLTIFAAAACSLDTMFASNKWQNNNVSIHSLDTDFFTHPHFQYSKEPFSPNGEGTNKTYIYTVQRGEPPITNYTYKNLTFLGQTMTNETGVPINNLADEKTYTKNEWGNIFYYQYFTHEELTYITKLTLTKVLENAKTATRIRQNEFTLKADPYYRTLRYNPYKDKGKGNQAYWVTNLAVTKNNWEPENDPDLIITDYPFWIMLYGWEDMTKRIGKCKNLDNDYILVLRSPYFNEKMKAIVPLSDSFVQGQGPYFQDRSEIKGQDLAHWYPRWRYQREAIENIIMSGPMMCHGDHVENIQAFIKYSFLFKWGGCPATMESVYDPMSQPITPNPNNLISSNEIINPETDIENYIYKFDTRRDILTQKATKRITESSIYEQTMFTDGEPTATDVPLFKKAKTQEKTTQEASEEEILQQLQQLQQYNLQLQLRFNNLKQLMQNI